MKHGVFRSIVAPDAEESMTVTTGNITGASLDISFDDQDANVVVSEMDACARIEELCALPTRSHDELLKLQALIPRAGDLDEFSHDAIIEALGRDESWLAQVIIQDLRNTLRDE